MKIDFKTYSRLILLLLIIFTSSYSYSYTSLKRGYKDAKSCYRSLMSSKKILPRDSWLECVISLNNIYERYPGTERGLEALFMKGKLYYRLYKYSGMELDSDMAIKSLRDLVLSHPKSKFADDSLYMIAEIYDKYKKDKKMAYIEYYRLLNNYPKSKFIYIAKKRLKELDRYKPYIISDISDIPDIREVSSKGKTLVKNIRYWSNPDYTRVVIDLENERKFSTHILEENKKFNKPQRIYFDIESAKVSKNVKKTISINGSLIKRIRVAQYSSDVVRVVLDMNKIGNHRIFTLYNPFRIVIDIFKNLKKIAIPGQLGSKIIRRVIIDPGHGGKDPGAIGYGGIKEKDITLKIAKELEKVIRKKLNLETLLTRRDDRFIPLEERTAIANIKKGDIFLSIHTNASPNKRTHGVEIYYLDIAKDKESMRIAARENALSSNRMGDLQAILNSLIQNSKIIESSRLAKYVHESIISNINGRHRKMRDLGVKQAPFVVLIGSQMPSILIESAFITNKYDARRLRSKKFIEDLANSISDGIKKYIEEGKLALK